MVRKLSSDTASESFDPDVRFLLANERTLLAWVRTGLTLQAGGFALAHFSTGSPSGVVTGIAAIVLGGFMAVVGYNRFRVADRAIRANRLPPIGNAPALQVVSVVVIAIVLAIVQAVDLW